MGSMSPVYETAIIAHDAGLCVLPPKENGSKAPDLDSWTRYQTTPASRADIETWYDGDQRSGLGLVTGAVSGNLEALDFDCLTTYRAFVELAIAAGLGELIERIEAGSLEETPGGGRHWFYRCDVIAGNTKLARRLKRPEEMRDEHDTIAPLIETRGEGGYVVVAPSNGRVHPSGKPYRSLRGGVETIATITPEERAELHTLARSFDAIPKWPPREPRTSPAGEGMPGEDYNARGDVLALLEDHGWHVVYTRRDGVVCLRRPGKECGTSATFGIGGTRYLYVFTTSTVFESERAYSPFAVYAKLEHDDDFPAAAQALAELGYGTPAARPITPGRDGARHGQDATWPALEDAALYGLAGDIVRAVAPHTEGDPVAILTNALAMFGSAVGSGPHTHVGGSRHAVGEFMIHVGETSRARKGTAYHEVLRLFRIADPEWCTRIMGGLSSGEGLIYAVRDATYKINKDGEEVLAESGVDDKRLLALEPEFAAVLRVASRDGSTLSDLLRRAWDGDTLRTLTRNSPLCATTPHVSLLGHITKPELLRELSETSQANGWANRHMFFCVRRSKLLPHGGALSEDAVNALARLVRNALHAARKRGELCRDDEANRMWEAVYPALTADHPGMLGAITARGEAHVLRVSLLYALLDGAPAIEKPHLAAALALWQYAEESARYIFGDATGDPVADRVLAALRRNGPMTQTELTDLFGRHVRSAALGRALEALVAAGMVVSDQVKTDGRPRTIWNVAR
jgi:hypothetical protein